MSLFYLRDPDAVLIHIPKTGGRSIRNGVWSDNYVGPRFGELPEAWRRDDLVRFAFVRHPFDRLVSAFGMFTRGTDYVAPRMSVDFSRFCEMVLTGYDKIQEPAGVVHHTAPITHPYNCIDDAQLIGRFEEFKSDFSRIWSSITDKPVPALPRINASNLAPRDVWRDYLDRLRPMMYDDLVDYYRDDFERFGYSASL